jgi:exo-1,4-beta-D-glucosaminidase
MCAQVAGYEAWRAMFEAHLRNFPLSTGVVAWMLNSSWPSLIWQLYDYYLNPLGGFFGVQKACEPLHSLYSYDDHSIWVCNSSLKEEKDLILEAVVYTMDLQKKFEKQMKLNVNALANVRLFEIAEIRDTTAVYFLRLSLRRGKKSVTDNFYWLANTPEVFAEKGLWYHFPLRESSDMRALRELPKAEITADTVFLKRGAMIRADVTVRNISGTLAFFLRGRVFDAAINDYALPVYWNENCVSLLPGETKLLHAEFAAKDSNVCRIEIDGWNCCT